MTLILHHNWDAVCPIKVRMCLFEKGVSFHSITYQIAALEHLVPQYLALNPNGVHPTLDHDGTVVVESSVINEYIDEVFVGAALMPNEPARRAEVRALVKFQDDMLHPATRVHTFSLMLTHPRSPLMELSVNEVELRLRHHPDPGRIALFRQMGREPASPSVLAAAEAAIDRALFRLAHQMADGRPWLVGDALTLADIAMAGIVDRIEHCGLARLWDTRPSLAAWVERLKARASYRAAIPTKDQRLPGPLNP